MKNGSNAYKKAPAKIRQTATTSLAPDGVDYVVDRAKLVEIVEGAEAIDDKLNDLVQEAQNEIASFITGSTISTERSRKSRDRNLQMYARGIRSRTIYLTKFREKPTIVKHELWINEQGSEVRTALELPTQMIIIDRKIAILPFDAGTGQHAIIIHCDPTVANCLQTLFELTWTSATPLGAILSDNADSISAEQRTVLDMLTIGRIDKEISQAMGVHPRTTARTVADLMARLNAKTRFMAGVQAAKRHWI
jgi:DNA-binding CsgD family transcriptional regulator